MDVVSDETLEQRRLARLEECHKELQGHPKLIKREFQRATSSCSSQDADDESNKQAALRVLQFNTLADGKITT